MCCAPMTDYKADGCGCYNDLLEIENALVNKIALLNGSLQTILSDSLSCP